MIHYIYMVATLFMCRVFIYGTKAETMSANECIRLVRYTKNVTAPYSKTVQETKKKFCFNFPFYCTTYETKTEWYNKTEVMEFTEKVKDCCVGYRELNGTCKPICERECARGNCVSPDRCLCEAGWTGVDCTQECDGDHYGHDCDELCSCQNGATCNKMNGTCYCAPGYIGDYCESKCPVGSFGSDCENVCRCENGAICETHVNEEEYRCLCKPGYTGMSCELNCPEGTYGVECRYMCMCEKNSTEFCSHLDGHCTCMSGYKGERCGGKCDPATWGMRCENACDCEQNATDCNHVTGECDCLPGWFGARCTETCPDGTYGYYCQFQCDCQNNEICDRKDGACTCTFRKNNTMCTPGALNSTDEINSTSNIILVILAIFVIFILSMVIIIIIIIRIKKQKRLKDQDIDFDEVSTETVISNQVLEEFSSQQFMNLIYGDCVNRDSAAYDTPIRSSTKSHCLENQPAIDDKNLSGSESKQFVNLAFDALFSSKGNRNSSNAVVIYSTSKENQETTDERNDNVSLYRISIYDDVTTEHHYANPTEILNDTLK